MPTLFSVGAYRVVVFVNDHAPAHVHALGPEGHARFALGSSPARVVLLGSSGVPRQALVKIAAEIAARHAHCRRNWDRIHAKHDPD